MNSRISSDRYALPFYTLRAATPEMALQVCQHREIHLAITSAHINSKIFSCFEEFGFAF
jgi:hypothetical protein